MERTTGFPDETRQEIRAWYRKLRDSMNVREAETKSRSICAQMLASEWYQKSRVIYGYYPLGNEVDCLPLLAQALSEGRTVALPAINRTDAVSIGMGDCEMEFYRIDSLTQVSEGSFHVMEPLCECPLIQVPDATVLVPGVVFDVRGNRYGYGKGYYDRYFARFPGAYRVAAAYDHQIRQELAAYATDISMHRIYTEKHTYRIGGHQQGRDIWN